MKALVIEDNMMERKALAKLFEICFPKEFSVVTAVPDGKSALDAMEKTFYDLVMLDINLPDMDGISILAKIKEKDVETKVIMTTAYSDYDHLRSSMRGNAFDYLVKPYSRKTFEESVQTFLSAGKDEEQFGQKGIIQKVKEYLDNHYGEQVQMDDVAAALNMNKSYISRVFKKETGNSIMGYLSEVRVAKAIKLLRAGMSVSETAEKVGFTDPAYFGKFFKLQTGISPSKYSEKH